MNSSLWLSTALTATVAAAQILTLDEVLFRANEMVTAYEREFSMAVTEEHYVQRILRVDGSVVGERTLVSELAFVREEGQESWLGLRDTVEVDGKPIRDRSGRLATLLSSGGEEALPRAVSISQESDKHVLRRLSPGTSVPHMALTFLHALNQHRFGFERIGEETVNGTSTWAVRYTEQLSPTLIQSAAFDLFARGTLWIDPSTGSLVRSQLLLGDQNLDLLSTVVVTLRPDDALGLWVPAELEETEENPQRPADGHFEGHATYGAFQLLDTAPAARAGRE